MREMTLADAWKWVDDHMFSHPDYMRLGSEYQSQTMRFQGDFLAGAWMRAYGEPREKTCAMYGVKGWDAADSILNPKPKYWKITRDKDAISFTTNGRSYFYGDECVELVFESHEMPVSSNAKICEVKRD